MYIVILFVLGLCAAYHAVRAFEGVRHALSRRFAAEGLESEIAAGR